MLLAFTGAGISAASGVPTFSEQEGIRDKLERSYANRNPEGYRTVIDQMLASSRAAQPNDGHLALAEYQIPIITMNVDGLHQRAGSQHVVEVHGNLEQGNIVLYGDAAPEYATAETWVGKLREGDIFLIIGTSYYTGISTRLKKLALRMGADVIEIMEQAETRVRAELAAHKDCIEPFEDFMSREDGDTAYPVRVPYSGGWY